MQPNSLGVVGVPMPGTPVRVSSDPRMVARRIRFAAVIGHTGKVYVGASNLDRATLSGVVKEFWPTGVGGGIADELLVEAPATAGNVLRLADYWVDANVPYEGLLVEYWVG
jgi:hypothetical protein